MFTRLGAHITAKSTGGAEQSLVSGEQVRVERRTGRLLAEHIRVAEQVVRT